MFIHALADVQSKSIGEGTSIWQYAIVLSGAKIGSNCNINSHTFIENDVEIGDNVTVKCGVYIWDAIRIEDDVFLGPNVVFTNDLRPRSKQRTPYAATKICKGASLGANTTVLAGVTIGRYAMTGIGSVVTRNIPDHALAYGVPAKVVGWVDEKGGKLVQQNDDTWVSQEGNVYKKTQNGLTRI